MNFRNYIAGGAIVAVAALGLLAHSPAAQANVLYNSYSTLGGGTNLIDQGFSNNLFTSGFYHGTSWGVGNTFTLSAADSITNLRFLGFGNEIDSYNWAIYAAYNIPGYAPAPLASATNVTNTVAGKGGQFNIFYIINFDVNLILPAGTYYLLFHDNSLTSTDQAIVQGSGGTGLTSITGGIFGSNTDINVNSGPYAIEVDGNAAPVPEPATLALVATGLLGTALARRKRDITRGSERI